MITGIEFISISVVNTVETENEFSNNAAQALGSPIELKNHNRLGEEVPDFNKIYSLKLNVKSQQVSTPSNPLLITMPQVNQQKDGEINGVYSQLRLPELPSSLTLNSASLKGQIALPLGLTWNLELKGNHNNLTVQPDWTAESNFSLRQLIEWCETQLSESEEEAQTPSKPLQGIKVIVPQNITNNKEILINLDNLQKNEIAQTPSHFQNLENSVQALSNRRLSQQFKFSWDANLNNVSLGLTSPLPGFLKDEIELRNSTNLSQLLINPISENNQFQGTVSLKYTVSLNKTMKLELQNDHNLNNNSHSTFIRWTEKY